MDNIYYVYMYLRDKNSKNGCKGSPYYIGKGKKDRAYSSHEGVNPPSDRNRIRILYENLSEDDAFMWEVFWIAEFGRIDLGTGCLRNRTDGGEGTTRKIVTSETRKKISESSIGKVSPESARKKISKANKGKTPWNKGRKETRSEVLENQRKVWDDIDRKTSMIEKNRIAHTGKKDSEEARKNKSKAQMGRKSWNKGQKSETVICPYCQKEGGKPIMHRFHMNNCKFKE